MTGGGTGGGGGWVASTKPGLRGEYALPADADNGDIVFVIVDEREEDEGEEGEEKLCRWRAVRTLGEDCIMVVVMVQF